MNSEVTNNKWKYFGRTAGGPVIFEIFRFPDNDKDLDGQDWSRYPEWLQSDGSWINYPDDLTIVCERAQGNFSEAEDEITSQEVHELYTLWSSQKWPGRQRKHK